MMKIRGFSVFAVACREIISFKVQFQVLREFVNVLMKLGTYLLTRQICNVSEESLRSHFTDQTQI